MEQDIATRRIVLSLIAALERQGVLDKETVEGILQAALTPPQSETAEAERPRLDIKL